MGPCLSPVALFFSIWTPPVTCNLSFVIWISSHNMLSSPCATVSCPQKKRSFHMGTSSPLLIASIECRLFVSRFMNIVQHGATSRSQTRASNCTSSVAVGNLMPSALAGCAGPAPICAPLCVPAADQTFKVLDHEGFTSAVEWHHVVSEVGENLTDEDVDVAHLSAKGFERATTIKFWRSNCLSQNSTAKG